MDVTYPTQEAFKAANAIAVEEARKRATFLANPFWANYPQPAKGGVLEEAQARAYVDEVARGCQQ